MHRAATMSPPYSRSLQLASCFLSLIFLPLLISAAAPPVSISRVEDAQYFRIYFGQSFKVIKNGFDGKSYLLTQRNSKMATRDGYCTGRIKSFAIPLSNYSLDTSTLGIPVSFFELLGLLESVKSVTSDEVTSECLLKSLSSGNTALVNTTDARQLMQFAAHFVSDVDRVQACNYVVFTPMEELLPLQRAEWIRYLAPFANAEARANAVYGSVKNNYLCLSKLAANQSGQLKPVVAWVEYKKGIWSFISDPYIKQLVRDAGGETVDEIITNNSYNVSDPDDMDNFHAILCTVSVLIDQTYAPSPAEYNMSTFLDNIEVIDNSCFAFLTNQSLWRTDKRVRTISDGHVTDWFDRAISQPQLVLKDLIEAFFPSGAYSTTFLRNLAKGEEVTEIGPETCDRGSSVALEPTIVPCQRLLRR
ncbi:uncharacterized protein LOC144717039 [Wolffia australiana]